ncbi:MAG: hypothetical protein H6818_03120 [Phycisphaerales bacterium]|nr:hypothetical protein [Phycisphaerales bacterium]
MFVFDRPLEPTEPALVPTVFVCPGDHTVLTMIHRLRPIIVTAPAVQGKSTLLAYIRSIWQNAYRSAQETILIAPPYTVMSNQVSLAGFLIAKLESLPASLDVVDILATSQVCNRNRESSRSTLIMLDLSQCTEPLTVHWIIHNILSLAGEHGELLYELRTQVLITGDYEVSMLGTGPSSPFAKTELRIRNLTSEETTRLCSRVSESSPVQFAEDAAQLVYSETLGDKYYTNILATHSILEAKNTNSRIDGEWTVSQSHVESVARDVRSGNLDDARVLKTCLETLKHDQGLIRTIHHLMEDDTEAWRATNLVERRELFRLGIVGLVGQNNPPMLSGIEPDYQIRNPMIRDRIRLFLSSRAKSSKSRRGDAGSPAHSHFDGGDSQLRARTTPIQHGSVDIDRNYQRAKDLTNQLHSTPVGRTFAHQYHDIILEALEWIFSNQLRTPRKEQKIHNGRKRIDICFVNRGDAGFFEYISRMHRIFCPYVFFECKNYSAEPGNPEFDQLTGRFSERRGKFGFLVCRELRNATNSQKVFERARDVLYDDRGVVLVLQDQDIFNLLELRKKGDFGRIDEYLEERLSRLIM